MNGKKNLLLITQKVIKKKPLSPAEISQLLKFEYEAKENRLLSVYNTVAFPLSLLAGALFVIYATHFENVTNSFPSWTNMSPELLAGVDYIWDFIGEPIGKANILYHLPNVILYTFGITGIKTLIETIERKTWIEKIMKAQELLRSAIDQGTLSFSLKRGHSLLFVGNRDFIGMQFSLNHKEEETITISQKKPRYTNVWSYYDVSSLYEDLKQVIRRADAKSIGEYIFFPVKDDQIFLPNSSAYDLSPHKLDIICQNIRTIESELKMKPRRIIIIGDKYHKSSVQSEDQEHMIANSEDIISLESICKKYLHTSLLDPSDLIIKYLLKRAKGRKIVFRATKDGLKEYKKRFYSRLNEFGYEEKTEKKGILTIGYDVYEDQTEQQTLSRTIDDYFPVVLSKEVRDALIRNGYKKNEFLYVPELVLQELHEKATEQ